jgi:hypothetical protein
VLKGVGKVDVGCEAPDDAKDLVGALKPGQKVKVLGRLGVYDNSIDLEKVLFRGL